ncbi:hypothetical protein HELRODRAFT_163095 [Helobdella robusta]|uniref:Ig-like domain-containing protein n=1 Tax=Helobdella robusta TaxID=6412 RepID=T1ETN1_HELRO|nr:hypothetical protein HELRODRAFT_163095 [Helobdella robusta]ESN96065.1 hypothetical protein HELRODRAFT_163095 [Helobdella robusta]
MNGFHDDLESLVTPEITKPLTIVAIESESGTGSESTNLEFQCSVLAEINAGKLIRFSQTLVNDIDNNINNNINKNNNINNNNINNNINSNSDYHFDNFDDQQHQQQQQQQQQHQHQQQHQQRQQHQQQQRYYKAVLNLKNVSLSDAGLYEIVVASKHKKTAKSAVKLNFGDPESSKPNSNNNNNYNYNSNSSNNNNSNYIDNNMLRARERHPISPNNISNNINNNINNSDDDDIKTCSSNNNNNSKKTTSTTLTPNNNNINNNYSDDDQGIIIKIDNHGDDASSQNESETNGLSHHRIPVDVPGIFPEIKIDPGSENEWEESGKTPKVEINFGSDNEEETPGIKTERRTSDPDANDVIEADDVVPDLPRIPSRIMSRRNSIEEDNSFDTNNLPIFGQLLMANSQKEFSSREHSRSRRDSESSDASEPEIEMKPERMNRGRRRTPCLLELSTAYSNNNNNSTENLDNSTDSQSQLSDLEMFRLRRMQQSAGRRQSLADLSPNWKMNMQQQQRRVDVEEIELQQFERRRSSIALRRKSLAEVIPDWPQLQKPKDKQDFWMDELEDVTCKDRDSRVELSCRYSTSNVKTRWFKNGQEIYHGEKYNFLNDDQGVIRLIIQRISKDDDGKYMVKVNNKLASTASLIVEGKDETE